MMSHLQFATPINWDHKLPVAKYEEQIANPAAELAILMRCSRLKNYRWEWYDEIEWHSNGIVRKMGLEMLTVMDIETHNKVSTASFNELPNTAIIGDLLFVIYPALFRCGRNGDQDIQVAKAVITVHVQNRQPNVKVEIDNKKRKSLD